MGGFGGALLMSGVAAWLAGCAATPPTPISAPISAPMPASSPASLPGASAQSQAAPPPPQPQPHDYAVDAQLLRISMAHEVPHAVFGDAADDAGWISRARAALAASPYKIASPQLLVAVDRNPQLQQMRVILAVPGGQWRVVGGGKVSTGRRGRKYYYITPTGVFAHDDAILDYRAEGSFNENHIRGLGAKGMRVWDFGWQVAQKGWHGNGDLGEIRMLMHATDPAVLEPRLGRPDSMGCVRISAAMNMFLDRHAVLDADYLQAAKTDPRYAAILPKDGAPSPYAGVYLVIFDSSRPG